MLKVLALSNLTWFFIFSSNAADFKCPKPGYVRCENRGKGLLQKGNSIQKTLREKNYVNIIGETEYRDNQRAYQLRRDPKNPNKIKLVFNIVPKLPKGAQADSVLDYKSLLKKCLVQDKKDFQVQGLPGASVEIDYYDKETNHNTDREAPPELKINIVAHPGQYSLKQRFPSPTVWPKEWCGLHLNRNSGKKGGFQKNRDIESCDKKEFKNCDLLRHELLQSAGLQSEKNPQVSLGESLVSSCHRDRKNIMNPSKSKFTSELSLDQFYFLTTPYCDHPINNHYSDCSKPYTQNNCVELAAKCKEEVFCSKNTEEETEFTPPKPSYFNSKSIVPAVTATLGGAALLCNAAPGWCGNAIGLNNTSHIPPQTYYAPPLLVVPASVTPSSVEAVNEKRSTPILYRSPYQKIPQPRATPRGSNGR